MKHYKPLRLSCQLWLFFGLFFLSHPSISQTPLLKGKVTEKDSQQPVPGALVIVKGTQRGTVTENDGTFSIEATNGETLVVSFIGYKTTEAVVQNTSETTNIALEPDEAELDEVVVIGYGTQKK